MCGKTKYVIQKHTLNIIFRIIHLLVLGRQQIDFNMNCIQVYSTTMFLNVKFLVHVVANLPQPLSQFLVFTNYVLQKINYFSCLSINNVKGSSTFLFNTHFSQITGLCFKFCHILCVQNILNHFYIAKIPLLVSQSFFIICIS